MKKPFKAFVIVILFLLIITQPVRATAENLLPDLREEHESLQPLEGSWEFYWESLLEPEDFYDGSPEPSDYIPIAGAWNGYRIDGEKLSGSGYATYRLEVLMDPERITAFRMPRILTAYRMWVDGKEVAGAGTVGTNLGESVPQYLTQQAFVMPEQERVEIIIQVSNFHHRSGGILESIYVGTDDQVLASAKGRLAYELFLFGSLLVMGVYHLVLYYYRKKDRTLLFFAVYCLVIGIRTVLVGEIYFIQLFPNFNWELSHKLQTLSYYSGVLILMLFFREMYRQYVPSWVVKTSLIIVGSFSGVVLLTPARIFNHINPSFQIFSLFASTYILIILFRICRKKEPGAFFIAFGYGFLILTMFHDLMYLSILMSDYQFLNHVILRGNLSSFGLLVFALTHSAVLAIKYADTFNKNEEMTKELLNWNENLEQLVEDRTTDLKESYKKIEEQNSALEKTYQKLEMTSQKDGLTDIWNRKHFDQVLKAEWARGIRYKHRLSLLFMDIDDFKDFNDQYGHQAGDDCLVQVAKVLKEKAKRSTDFVARYGGEEFVVMLADTDEEGTALVAEAIRSGIEALGVTVSIGVSAMIPSANISAEKLIRLSDQAMYQAKENGKNQVVTSIESQADHVTAQSKLKIISETQ